MHGFFDIMRCFSLGVIQSQFFNVEFTMFEFLKALKKGRNTAPGKDQLCYKMFPNLSPVSRGVILSFFNLVWRMGVVPSSWRHGVVVPLSYHPIALTFNMFKFMERLVTMRIN